MQKTKMSASTSATWSSKSAFTNKEMELVQNISSLFAAPKPQPVEKIPDDPIEEPVPEQSRLQTLIDRTKFEL